MGRSDEDKPRQKLFLRCDLGSNIPQCCNIRMGNQTFSKSQLGKPDHPDDPRNSQEPAVWNWTSLPWNTAANQAVEVRQISWFRLPRVLRGVPWALPRLYQTECTWAVTLGKKVAQLCSTRLKTRSFIIWATSLEYTSCLSWECPSIHDTSVASPKLFFPNQITHINLWKEQEA